MRGPHDRLLALQPYARLRVGVSMKSGSGTPAPIGGAMK